MKKTYKEWVSNELKFNEYFKPGSEIDERTYMYFLEMMPPARMGHGYFMVGEPASTTPEGEFTYSLFVEEGNRFFYINDIPMSKLADALALKHVLILEAA